MVTVKILTAISSHRKHAHIIFNCNPAEAMVFKDTVRYSQQVLNVGLEHG